MEKLNKTCNNCKKPKPISDFNKFKNYILPTCRECKSIYDRKRRSEKGKEIASKNRDRYLKLTPEEKKLRHQKKKKVLVNCSKCKTEFLKRKDTLSNWSGLCYVCSRKEVASRPEIKAINSSNGLNFIKKFGKIPSPKMENRRRGENHHNWGVSRKGEESFNWRGGITPDNEKIRHSKEYRDWRISVFERDNYTCVNCGDNKGGNLNADHIKPFSLFPDLRLSIDNGRTLCIDCHKKIGWSPSKTKLKGNTWVCH